MRILTKSACAVLLLTGCSLINSLDSVKPQATDGGSGAQGGNGSGGKGGSSSGGKGGTDTSDASTGGQGGNAGGSTGGGGGAGAGGGPIDSGNPDVFAPNGPEGAIVAYNKPGGTNPPAPTLIVISPKTGEVLSSEPFGSLRCSANDARTNVWYLWEQTGTPTDPVVLHVRELDSGTGQWRELSKLSGVPYPAYGRAVPLTDRLAYLSTPTPISPDQQTHTLTILDTSDTKNVTILGGSAAARRPINIAGRKTGITGVPAGNNPGGTIDVMVQSTTCPAGEAGVNACDVTLVSYSLGSQFLQNSTKVVGAVPSSGLAQIERDANGGNLVVAFPALINAGTTDCSTSATTEKGIVKKFAPLDFGNPGQAPVQFTMSSESLTASAYDSCFDVMLVGAQLHDHGIWTIPLGGPPANHLCRGPVAAMLFEPFTRTLIVAPVGSGAPDFYALGGNASAPTLTLKQLPKLPTKDFAPLAIAVRQPPGYQQECPSP